MSAEWPTAAEWLAGSARDGVGGKARLVMAGVPLAAGAVTPSRYDLTPAAVRARLERFSDFHSERMVRLPPVRDHGDSILPPELHADLTILVGGHNGVTFEALRPCDDLDRWALLTLDAHHDVRPFKGRPGNGSPVRALIESGLPGRNVVQVGIHGFSNSPHDRAWAEERGVTVHGPGAAGDVTRILDDLAARADHIYVDLDVDVLDRAFAPGCPGARPGGLSPRQLFDAAFTAGAHPAVRAVDVVEVDAEADVASITVDAAALCLLNAAAGFALRTASRPD